MKKLVYTGVFAAIFLMLATVMLHQRAPEPTTGEYVIALNEIEQLLHSGEQEAAVAHTQALRMTIRQTEAAQGDERLYILCGICLAFLAGITTYCGIAIVRPFEKLTQFAEEIAGGNLDLPLEYERSNYFGKFTWAFDRMRREITRARSCEQEAIENNKTVIAALSHDIKTPVASVRAYAEALEMGMDQTPEQREAYLSTMLRKCDEITKLTNDMLTHALSELGSLRMKPQRLDLGKLVGDVLEALLPVDIRYEKPLYPLEVDADPDRLAQVLENLVHNARKYAKTEMTVSVMRQGDMAVLQVHDTGGGIPDEDMPFVCGRFYRGTNIGTENGAGLGLYIVSYIVKQSGGTLTLANRDGGLCVRVALPVGI